MQTVSCLFWSAHAVWLHALWLESCQSQMVHLWWLFFFFPLSLPVVFTLTGRKHLDFPRFIPSPILSVISNIHLCLSATIPATTASSDSAVCFNLTQTPRNAGSVRLLNYTRVGATCCTASSSICSICCFSFSFTGSNSGYQANPSQLPEDVVHSGRDSCVPNRIHTVVCGNNEQTAEAATACCGVVQGLW